MSVPSGCRDRGSEQPPSYSGRSTRQDGIYVALVIMSVYPFTPERNIVRLTDVLESWAPHGPTCVSSMLPLSSRSARAKTLALVVCRMYSSQFEYIIDD